MNNNTYFMQRAIDLAVANVQSGKGGPFGAVVVKNGLIIAEGCNKVTTHNDPTAHAEVEAIRAACRTLGHFQLTGCQLYTSCEPCPMCLGAIYWARPDRVYFANTQLDAAEIGFDDAFIYEEIALTPPQRRIPFIQMMRTEALISFKAWTDKADKVEY